MTFPYIDFVHSSSPLFEINILHNCSIRIDLSSGVELWPAGFNVY
jgi:hypothetical protein